MNITLITVCVAWGHGENQEGGTRATEVEETDLSISLTEAQYHPEESKDHREGSTV